MNENIPHYLGADVEIRDDIKASHREMLTYLVSPGPWFSGAERRSIALESRNAASCALCSERKESLSPEHPAGEHTRVSDLPEPLVEMAHRIRRDPQRLSRPWFEKMLASGLSEGQYAEAVGVVTFTAGLDYFCLALGIYPFEFPQARAGEPSGYRPDGLREGIAWLSILAPEDAAGPEENLYEEAEFVPNIARALSQIPDHVRCLQDESRSHYLAISELGDPMIGRDLDRLQMELVASRVSALNECFY